MQIQSLMELSEIRGRAHGDCSCCEIAHKLARGEQIERDVDDCTKCYMSGRPLDFAKLKRILLAYAADGKKVVLPDGRFVLAEEALSLAYSEHGFRIAACIN